MLSIFLKIVAVIGGAIIAFIFIGIFAILLACIARGKRYEKNIEEETYKQDTEDKGTG